MCGSAAQGTTTKTIVRDSKVCIYNDINVKKCNECNGTDRKTAKKQKKNKRGLLLY